MKNQPINISVIGTGRMGYYHARLLSRLGYLHSIVDRNIKRAKEVSNQFGVPFFPTIDEFKRADEVEAVIIAVPTRLHFELTKQVIKKFPNLKVLLIEKPVATSVEEALLLKDKLAKTNIKTIIGHVEAFNPVIARIIEIVKSGVIGKPRTAIFQRRGAVSEDRFESIGDVYEDIGVHDFDVALRIFNLNKIKLYSTAVRVNGYENSSIVLMSATGNDLNISFHMSREFAGKMRQIEIEGTKATISANLLTQIIEIRSLEIAKGEKKQSAVSIPFSNGEQIKIYGEPLFSEMFNIIDCVLGRAEPIVTIDDGIKALKVVEAVKTSLKTGNIVEIDV